MRSYGDKNSSAEHKALNYGAKYIYHSRGVMETRTVVLYIRHRIMVKIYMYIIQGNIILQ